MFPVYVKDETFRPPADPVYYLRARDGLYLVKQNRFFRSVIPVSGRDAADTHGLRAGLPPEPAGLLPQAEEIVPTFPPIPPEILEEAVTFFAHVARTHSTEAVALLYYDVRAETYRLIVPRQRVTDMHARYEVGTTPEGLQRVGTLHSHVGDAAFHSEADRADEQADDGLHIVVGLGGGHRSVTCAVVVDGRRRVLAPDTLFGDTWERALGASGGPPRGATDEVTPVDPAGPARRALEARYGVLGSGRQVLLIGDRPYALPEVMLALGLAFEDTRVIDGGELSEGLYVVRFFDGETRQVVALEFDPQFRPHNEIRVHIAEWMGDDYYDFPWGVWCAWSL
ncbi:MAG TPA: Mov34/MPN/PAD-1 family protein [bacterium]|nr:Mov34/MPN/PAD-1 family protein [bacterium]